MSIQHLPNSTSAERVVEILNRDGAVVVDSLVTTRFMDELGEELRPYIEATKPGPDSFSGRRTRRTGALIARSPKSRELVMHPLALETTRLLLTGATGFRLHLTQAIAIGPGEPAQPIHRDQWAYDFFSFPKGYEVQCNTIWAMTDFTIENGGTRVIIGSNHFDDGLRFAEADSEGTEMSKGSVLFYTGSVYHGGGANHSNATRVGINITYNRSWLRQEENQYLATPLEIARTLPVELLRLMGYARGAYALGYVGDLLDPIAVIRPELADAKLGDLEQVEAQQIRAQAAQGKSE
jgi:hypothetical protein